MMRTDSVFMQVRTVCICCIESKIFQSVFTSETQAQLPGIVLESAISYNSCLSLVFVDRILNGSMIFIMFNLFCCHSCKRNMICCSSRIVHLLLIRDLTSLVPWSPKLSSIQDIWNIMRYSIITYFIDGQLKHLLYCVDRFKINGITEWYLSPI